MKHIDIAEISDLAQEKINELDNLVSDIETKIDNSVGTLTVRRKKSVLLYYERVNGKERYVNRQKTERLKRLQNNYYNRRLLKAANSELQILKMTAQLLKEIPDTEKVFFDIPKEKRHLIEPFTSKKDDYLISKSFMENRWPKECTFKTLGGEMVRSKSELIIADRLYDAGLSYCYEYPTHIKGGMILYPDFYVVNKNNGRKYYWEHFGMMDNPEYCARSLEKLEIYEKNNIVLGKNLIVTMESKEHQINTDYIDSLIRQYLF